MGSDVLLQPSTLQADNHKKRTGFGPQQASFGVYVSNAFGGMSGALKSAAALQKPNLCVRCQVLHEIAYPTTSPDLQEIRYLPPRAAR